MKIHIPEGPGFEGIRGIVRTIKKEFAGMSPWDDPPPIVLEGTEKALRLIRLMRLNQIEGIILRENG